MLLLHMEIRRYFNKICDKIFILFLQECLDIYEIKYINGKICQAKATNLYCMTDIIYIIT